MAILRLAAEREVSFKAEVYFTDRYPGFDLDDPDWPALRQQIDDVGKLLDTVKTRVAPKS